MDALPSPPQSFWQTKILAFLSAPKATTLVILFAILLCAPSLWVGIFGDDHFHRVRMVKQDVMPAKTDLSLFGLFTVSNGSAKDLNELVVHGLMPWYVQEGFRFQPWRPLAELTHVLDYRLWPTRPWMMHLHQLLWIAAFFLAVKAFYKHLFPASPLLAALATMLVVLDGNMAQTHYWLAGRNTLIAATFSLLCLLSYSRSVKEANNTQYLLAILSFAAALFSSELALGATAFLFSYACFMQQGSLTRFLRLTPFALVGLIFVICYKAGHQGVAGSDWYFDPLKEPSAFFSAVLFRFPKAFFQQFFILPLEIFGKVNIGSLAWLLGWAMIGFLFYLLRPMLKTAVNRFLMLGALLSIVPLCAGPGIPRSLLLVSIGILPVVAEFILHSLKYTDARRSARIFVWAFMGLHALGILVIPATGFVYSIGDANYIQAPARNLDVSEQDFNKQWINLNATDAMQAMLYPLVRAGEQLGLPKNWYLSGAGLGEIKVNVLSDHSLEITSSEAFMSSPANYFVRKKNAEFAVGQSYAYSGMQVTVTELTDDKRPRSVRFDFEKTLTDDQTVFFACQGDKLNRLSLAQLKNQPALKCGS